MEKEKKRRNEDGMGRDGVRWNGMVWKEGAMGWDGMGCGAIIWDGR